MANTCYASILTERRGQYKIKGDRWKENNENNRYGKNEELKENEKGS